MQVRIDCQISLPKEMVKEIADRFELGLSNRQLVIGSKDYWVMETLLSEWVIEQKIKQRLAAYDAVGGSKLGLTSVNPNPVLGQAAKIGIGTEPQNFQKDSSSDSLKEVSEILKQLLAASLNNQLTAGAIGTAGAATGQSTQSTIAITTPSVVETPMPKITEELSAEEKAANAKKKMSRLSKIQCV